MTSKVYVEKDGDQVELENLNLKTITLGHVMNHYAAVKRFPLKNLRIFLGGDELDLTHNSERTMLELGVENGARIRVLLKEELKKVMVNGLQYELTNSIPCFVTMVTECDNVILDCGHVISKDGMKMMVRCMIHSSDSDGSIRCTAPVKKGNESQRSLKMCDQEIPYRVFRDLAQLEDEEAKEFENGITKRYLQASNIKSCPGCECFIDKDRRTVDGVSCVRCERQDFCWNCLKDWKVCGGALCLKDRVKDINALLNDSEKKTIGLGISAITGVPSHRLCPNCSVIIEHQDGCKHMMCTACKTSFCWVCLKIKSDSISSWTCGAPYEMCPGGIAPVQRESSS